MANNIKTDSAYHKLQRLISKLSINMLHLSVLMLSWFYKKNEKFHLTIDRTQWELGKSKINFLVVAAPCKRMAISLFWILLSKKGNFNYKERVELQDLRCLLIHGARAVLQSRNRREDAMGDATVISLPKRF